MTKFLLIRADDLGYSEGVNHGIRKSVVDGLIRSVGLMPNMEAAVHGFELVADLDIALGQHTSVCIGYPVADAAQIPSLVGPDGQFKPSRAFREAYAAGEDFVDFDQAKIEVRAQLERFRIICGRDPDYFEGHAVASPTLMAAIEEVRQEEGLRPSCMSFDGSVTVLPSGREVRCCGVGSMNPDYDARGWLEQEVLAAPEGSTSVYICHPGYLDEYILNNSTLTRGRPQETAMLCDPETRAWLDARGVELIDYRDLD